MANRFSYKDILNEIARKDKKSRKITDKESELLKQCLYDMAVDLDKRCRKYDIKLFLVGGTLLGAVRHHGFIPWDDDIDLGLERDDYEKLKAVFDKEFSDEYELRCPNSPYPNANRFMQIYKKNTVLKKIGDNNPLQPHCVYIDIFPYDYVPENKIYQRLKGIKSNALMFISSCVVDEKYTSPEFREYLKQSKEGILYINIRRLVGRFFAFREPEKWFNKVDKSVRYKKSELVTSATGRRHYFGEIYPANAFFPLKELEFIDHDFYVPAEWNVYLEGNYGKEYMIPPEETKHESHFITEFSIGKVNG